VSPWAVGSASNSPFLMERVKQKGCWSSSTWTCAGRCLRRAKGEATEAVGAAAKDVGTSAAEGVGARTEIALMETERVMSPDSGGRRYPERARAAPGNLWETTAERVWITPRTKKRAGRRG
jgi:hypothetical protein